MRQKLLKNLPLITLILLLLAGFAVRLYDLTEEPLDWNMIRQLRDATIARSLYYQVLPNADPTTAEQAQYLASHLEVLELPVLEGLMAFLYLFFGETTWLVRIVNAICWCLGGVFIYQISKRHFSLWAAIAALFFYLFLPFGIMASRAFQPDAWLIMWVLLSYWMLYRYLEEESWRRAIWAGLAAGWALMIKPTAALYVGPAFLAVILNHYGLKHFWRKGKVWCIAALALIPVTVYSLFISEASSSHFDLWVRSMNSLRFSFQFYIDWMLNVKRLTGLAYIALALTGVLVAPNKLKSLLIGGWIGYVLYGLLYPFQYSTHDYYHLFIVPLITLSLLSILDFVVRILGENHFIWRIGFTGILLAGAGIGFLDVKQDLDMRDYRSEAAAWAAIGEQIPDDGCLLTLATDYGLRLRYYGWRGTCAFWPTQLDFSVYEQAGKGSPNYEERFADSSQGMDYFVVLSMEEWKAQTPLQEILVNYPLIAEGDGFLVFDLRN